MQSITALLAFLSKGEYDDDESSALKEFEGGMPFADFDPDADLGGAAPGDMPAPKLSQVGTGGQAGAASTIATATKAPAAGPSGEQKDPTEPQGHDRLYLSEIPGGKPPEGYKGKTFTGRQGSNFIDARLLSPKMKEEMKPHDENKNMSYGGVIINDSGEVLLRKPKDGFGGYEWTFAKGGADKNEDPMQAALREVREETGLHCEIVGDIPGHFTTSVNNKFWLMKVVGGDKSQFQANETSDAQFFDPAQAESQIKLTGSEWDNHDGVERDLAILKAAFHENGKQQKEKSKVDGMLNRLSTGQGGLKKWKITDDVSAIADHYFEHGSLPDALTNPLHEDYSHYQPFREEILDRLANPSNTSNSINNWIGQLYNSTKMKEKYGSGAAAAKSYGFNNCNMKSLKDKFAAHWRHGYEEMNQEPIMITEYIGESIGSPQNYAKGQILPVDIDLHGNKMFRASDERKALVKAWEKWSSGTHAERQSDSFSVGKLPDRYDAELRQMVKGEKYDFRIGGWELAGERASSVQKERDALGIDTRIDKFLTDWGKDVPKLHSTETNKAAGQRLVRDFIHMHRNLSTQLLNMAYPKTDHVVLWRGSSAYAEGARPSDIAGVEHKLSSSDLHKLGMPKKEEETADNAFESYIHTKPAAGWGFSPQGFGSKIALGAEVPKHNIFMSSMDLQGLDHEMEWVVMNDPNMRAKVFHHHQLDGFLSRDETWEYMDKVNGVSPEGVFRELPTNKKFGVSVKDDNGDTQTWNIGVQDPETDWQKEYGAAQKTDAMTGTAPGGVITGPDGEDYYLKHGREGQHVVESLANDVYRKAGIMVPETKLVNYGGKVAHVSKLVADPKTDPSGESLSNIADIQEGYLVDALLGNHDFIGVGPENPHGNIVSSGDGRHYRIDNGGSLYLSGTGAQKTFGKADDMKSPIRELEGFRDPDINPRAAKVFEGMTHETMMTAFTNLSKLDNSTLANLVHESGIPPYKMQEMTEALISRRDNIVQHLVDTQQVLHPQTKEPMSFRQIEQEYELRKADTIYEDNPVGAPVTDLPVKEALEILKKRPLLQFLDDFKGEESDDA